MAPQALLAASNSRLINISTRGDVGTGDNVLIAGFAIRGETVKRVIIRALGPSLSTQNVAGALADPSLALVNSAGAQISVNRNWRDNQATAILATGLAPSSDLESAIVIDLPPENYTVIVSGENDSVGIALVEVYELN